MSADTMTQIDSAFMSQGEQTPFKLGDSGGQGPMQGPSLSPWMMGRVMDFNRPLGGGRRMQSLAPKFNRLQSMDPYVQAGIYPHLDGQNMGSK